MRILVVSQYFWPESFVINDLVRAVSRAGHVTTVVTGKPNYPGGQIAAGYAKRGVTRETFADDVEVIRVPLHPRGKANALGLALNYLSFVFSATLRLPRLMRGREFDAVFFFGLSPLTAALPAVLIAWLKRAHLALWIQDLWPDALSNTGLVKSRILLGIVGLMVRFVYARADTLLLQSEAFVGPVSSYAKAGKIVYFPNPAPDFEDTEERPLPGDVEVQFENCFAVVFAGNLGRVQSLKTIVETAKLLRGHAEIRLIIAGTGSEAEGLQRSVAENNLSNLRLIGLLDRDLMPALFRQANALLVTLRDAPTLGLVIPSKVQAYMQAGKPIIAALNGEGARIIEAAGAGLVVPAEDSASLAQSILALYAMPDDKRRAMGTAGRRYFEAHFEAGKAARRLIDILEGRMGIQQRG